MSQIDRRLLFSFALIAVLLASNVLLLRSNTRLNQSLEAQERATDLKAGALAPDLVGSEPDGKPLTLHPGLADRVHRTLLFVFSPTCQACDRNWPNWVELTAAAEKAQAKKVYIDLSGEVPQDYIARHELADRVVITNLTNKTAVSYRFNKTPQTIVLSPDGLIEKVLTGILTKDEVSAIRAIL